MKSRRKKKENGVLSFSLYILVVILLAVALRAFVVERVVVVGESMEPTLDDGDNILIEKISGIKRYDIVVFPAEGALLIKRVYGLPGENIRIDDTGLIYINDKVIDDRYAYEITRDPGIAAGDGITLGADEYFVMGDNRNNSSDSRIEAIGSVKKKNIRGKAMLRLTPLSDFGKVDR